MDRMMSSLPQPPHRRRFIWWHVRFCGPCKDYQREAIEALQEVVGRTMNIPQFASLSDASIYDAAKIEWYEGEDIRVTKDDLLRRAYDDLLAEHHSLCCEFGDVIPRGERYHPKKSDMEWGCDTCDLLRDIDKSLEPACPPSIETI